MRCTSRVKGLTVTLKPGTKEVKQIPDCKIKFINKCFKIEKVDYPTASSVTAAIGAGGTSAPAGGRKRRNAKSAAVESAEVTRTRQIRSCLMNVTPATYYLKCLCLSKMPECEEWFCPLCKNDDDINVLITYQSCWVNITLWISFC